MPEKYPGRNGRREKEPVLYTPYAFYTAFLQGYEVKFSPSFPPSYQLYTYTVINIS
jgi:hypothetical protein